MVAASGCPAFEYTNFMERPEIRRRAMRIKTSTTITPSGKVKVRTTTKAAPMLPAMRTSSTFSLVPGAPKRRRRKKR
ncbi:MAG: hypothetical protein AVDCRST_MAG14-1332 [uncultured Rubrobacteraceae bacterium]|uniref:Uncharacterized protein n=1 Tax=uncultured Rubrobacteraceae bacterium TaxID=349277 RepID=A0A6J4QUS8_9ACTN|nr:MAG: hypothetical protein AVDCRST_MAG14-1332 [uncultured Rubrobacteraceae bacterium]